MTFNQTTAPSAATEPASQYSEADPFGLDDIPDFLRRSPGKIKRRPRPRKTWHITPAMKAAAQKDQERHEKITARPVVLRAIEDGADTFGKIRKATDLSNPWIQAALRFHVKERAILKTGKRYWANTRLANLARFAVSHGFRVEPMDDGIIVYIPWTHRDGSKGETAHEVSTMAALRDVLGY